MSRQPTDDEWIETTGEALRARMRIAKENGRHEPERRLDGKEWQKMDLEDWR